MEKSNKRGKIPQSDWPSIMARYEAGETLSSIARTYDCSPPAISYVVSRSRARQPQAAPPPASGAEPQLIKAAAASGSADPPPDAAAAAAPANQPPVARGASHRDEMRLREANGFAGHPAGGQFSGSPSSPPRHSGSPSVAASGNGDARRRLHLALGSPSGSGAAPAFDAQPAERPNAANGQQAQPQAAAERGALPANREAHDSRTASEAEYPGRGPAGRDGPVRPGGGSFIDKELRARVDGDIAAFLAAFDAALGQDTQESRSLLREATDRLLRAGARTRIELERLEARVPLAARDGGGRRSEPAWRDRY